MPNNKIYNIEQVLVNYKNESIVVFSLFALLAFALSIYFNTLAFITLPAVCLLLLLFVLYPEKVFFLLIVVMPFSIEYDYKSSSIDLPSEPLLIVLSALTVIYFLLNFEKVKTKFSHNTLMVLILAHLFWTYTTTVLSTNILVSVKTSIVKTIYIIGFYVATILFVTSINKLKKLIWLMWLPTFLTIIFALYKHYTLGFTFESINEALRPLYRNHVNYGVFITMLVPFVWYLFKCYKKGTIQRLFLGISFLVLLVAIYLTYTRGAWLALLSMPLYFLVIKYKWTKPILIVLTLAVFVFTTYLFSNNNYQKYAPNFEKTIYHSNLSAHLNSTFEMEDMSTVERFYRWLAAIKMSKHHLVYGVGAGNFTENYKPYTVSSYQTYISANEEKSTVHNYFLLMLTEQGIIGLIIFIVFIFYILIYIENLYHQQSSSQNAFLLILIALSIFAFLVNNSLSDFVETNKVGSLFWINLGLLSLFEKQK